MASQTVARTLRLINSQSWQIQCIGNNDGNTVAHTKTNTPCTSTREMEKRMAEVDAAKIIQRLPQKDVLSPFSRDLKNAQSISISPMTDSLYQIQIPVWNNCYLTNTSIFIFSQFSDILTLSTGTSDIIAIMYQQDLTEVSISRLLLMSNFVFCLHFPIFSACNKLI